MKRSAWLRMWVLALTLAFTVSLAGLTGLSGNAWAQTHPHKKNFAQRHPTLTSVGAGYAAYKIAKTTGKNRQMHGGKKNFAQRHPIMTGVAAGMVTHHVIKKSTKKP